LAAARGPRRKTGAPPGPPGINDQAVLSGAGGTITLGGATHEVDTIWFQLFSSGYSIADGTLEVRSLTNAGDETNTIDVGTVRARTDFLGQPLFISMFDNLLPIRSTIVDGAGGPTDIHAHARFTNAVMHTGITQAWSMLELAGTNGRITDSQTLTAWGGTFALNNALDVDNDSFDNDFNFDRVPDTATVQLKWGRLHIDSRNDGPSVTTETIGQIDLLRGASTIEFNPADIDRQIVLTAADNLQPLRRDSTLEGRATAVISDMSLNAGLGGPLRIKLGAEPAGMVGSGTIQSVVPYLSTIGDTGGYMPVTYDPGNDGTIGNNDDVGLRPLSQFELVDMNALSSPTQNAAANSFFTVSTPTVVNSLTFTEGELSMDNELTVTSGAVFYSGFGYTLFSGPGGLNFGSAEGIIHANGNDATIDTPIRGTNGLTIAGPGTVWLTQSNSYTGGTVVNGGRLVIATHGALGGGDVVMIDGDLQVDYAPDPGQEINNNIVFENWVRGPLFAGAGVRELRLVDDSTLTLTGHLEGDGVFTLAGNNVRVILTNAIPSVAFRTPNVWVGDTQTLQLDGLLGNYSVNFGFSGAEIFNGGALVGSGTIDGLATIHNGGVLRPGDDQPGIMTVRQLNLDSGGCLQIQIGGLDRGIDLDGVDVLDFGANLNGEIELIQFNGFVPQVGDRFEILTVTGSQLFNTSIVDGFGLPAGRLWRQFSDADSLFVTIGGIDGDANFDGKVDIQDLFILAQNWQAFDKLWTDADFTFDGNVNVADLTVLARNWQVGVGSPLGMPLNTALATLGLPSASVQGNRE
jgi:autotransporter-associated beta strand protein